MHASVCGGASLCGSPLTLPYGLVLVGWQLPRGYPGLVHSVVCGNAVLREAGLLGRSGIFVLS
jgi:hypothetical protein